MAVLFTDNFDTGTEPGTNWTDPNAGGHDWDLVSGVLRLVVATVVPGVIPTSTLAHADTADVKVTVTQVSSGGNGGPVARWSGSGSSSTGYAVDVDAGVIEIYRHNGVAAGDLLRTASITQVANGVIRLEVSGSATVTLKQFYNGTQQGADVSDGSASRITAANRTGVYSWVTGATGDYDDFQVEDFAAAATKAIPVFHRATRFFHRSF